MFDTTMLALLEEHVRQLLQVMGFTEVKVFCRVKEPAPAVQTQSADYDPLLGNAALSSPVRTVRRARPNTTRPQTELQVNIEAGDVGKLLIGAHGAHLGALEQVIRIILRRKLEDPVHISVDVNGYRAARAQRLIELAEQAAQEARSSGRIVELKPMGPSDRRILHTALAARTDVQTESKGDEPKRRVIIRPVFL